MPAASGDEIGSDFRSYIGAGAVQDGRYVVSLNDCLDAGELASLVGTPIHNNGDIADLSLTADEWATLMERRRRVCWPLLYVPEKQCG
ncbi:hypothetical protein [Xanthomonas arboricola]|uniref:hypothetical protein n=1 Tax=Xanthomonas arboricola TaxID=56448 RepID=UPI000E1E4E44|nr:hypothetical protein [Xanthomonas arboricola]